MRYALFLRAAGRRRFVYGLRVHGLDRLTALSPDADGDDTISVRVSTDEAEPATVHPLDVERCTEPLGPAHQWAMDRAAGTARLVGPPLDSDLLAHPCLAPVATAFNRWAGRECFHAAGFVSGGRAYGVIGARTAGKSTLMAGLAHRGVPVLSDDVVITDGAYAYAGPRCIDLRNPIPGLDLATVSARFGTRFRLPLPTTPARVPLGGWIFLHWGTDVSMGPCSPASVLSRLAQWRGRRGLVTDPAVLLDLATRPAWDLIRPVDWTVFDRVTRTVTDTLDTLHARLPAPA